MKRKVRLSVTKVVRQTTVWSESASAFCAVCYRETETLTVAQSAAFLETDPKTLSELIAFGKIHAIETAIGNLRVCKNSLQAEGSVRKI